MSETKCPLCGQEPCVWEPCWICGKLKGQPPERCNGHYEGTASDPRTGAEAMSTLNRDAIEKLIREDIEVLNAALPQYNLERQHIELVLLEWLGIRQQLAAEQETRKAAEDRAAQKQINHEPSCTVFGSGPCACGFSFLRERIAELERTVTDEAVKRTKSEEQLVLVQTYCATTVSKVEAERDAAQAREEQLVQALQPFAEVGNWMYETDTDSWVMTIPAPLDKAQKALASSQATLQLAARQEQLLAALVRITEWMPDKPQSHQDTLEEITMFALKEIDAHPTARRKHD